MSRPMQSHSHLGMVDGPIGAVGMGLAWTDLSKLYASSVLLHAYCVALCCNCSA